MIESTHITFNKFCFSLFCFVVLVVRHANWIWSFLHNRFSDVKNNERCYIVRLFDDNDMIMLMTNHAYFVRNKFRFILI